MSHESRDSLFIEEKRRLDHRKGRLMRRSRMINSIRNFFLDHDYLEVETPQLIPAPAPETHIDAIKAEGFFLHTSPELCMKRLLAAGFPRIFQITKCFRNNERGEFHLPEFTMLEWYHSGIEYRQLMEECRELILNVSEQLGSPNKIRYRGRDCGLKSDWEKISVSRAFEKYSHLSMKDSLDKGLFDVMMATEIEIHLGTSTPTFLYDYPASHAALSRLKPGNRALAERFELYAFGLELANGFSELTDAGEQRRRFEKERISRQILGNDIYPMPEKFLQILDHMPQASGIALGLDRLAMLYTDSTKIDDVVAFTPEEL